MKPTGIITSAVLVGVASAALAHSGATGIVNPHYSPSRLGGALEAG
ncbi:hypothetical protein [Paracoccus aerodenitrificans]|nr:hypothetical protein [Paracoccus aerodenitrificans]WBU62570.1 hypothetical protein PAE61_00505 [Paracoccus aerodenitrificans]